MEIENQKTIPTKETGNLYLHPKQIISILLPNDISTEEREIMFKQFFSNIITNEQLKEFKDIFEIFNNSANKYYTEEMKNNIRQRTGMLSKVKDQLRKKFTLNITNRVSVSFSESPVGSPYFIWSMGGTPVSETLKHYVTVDSNQYKQNSTIYINSKRKIFRFFVNYLAEIGELENTTFKLQETIIGNM